VRIIKLGIISIIFFAFLITGISLFFPSHIRLSKAINISSTPAKVWEQVDNIRNWNDWNPLMSGTTGKKTSYIDTANGIWNHVRIEQTDIYMISKSGNEHTAGMQSGNRRPVINGWVCIGNPRNASDSITVQWYMDFHLHWYPWEKFGSLTLEKNYGPAMEEGLARMKAMLERHM
jgi:hypothetical protein